MPINAYDWFFKEIISWEIKPKFKQQFVQLYCRKYCEANQSSNAYTHYIQYRQSDSEFIIEDNATRLCLLKFAILQRDYPGINLLSEHLPDKTADSKVHKQTLLLLLKFYVESASDNTRSKHILELLIQHYPEMKSNEWIKKIKPIIYQN